MIILIKTVSWGAFWQGIFLFCLKSHKETAVEAEKASV
jgi:hypothetical protein